MGNVLITENIYAISVMLVMDVLTIPNNIHGVYARPDR